MKKLFLIIVMAIFGAMAMEAFPLQAGYAYSDQEKKKDPAGPPVVKDKPPRPKEPPREPPKRDRKPDV